MQAEFNFVPHSGPFARGIHVTVQGHAKRPIKTPELLDALREFYRGQPFVRVAAEMPHIKDVAGSNYAFISGAANGSTIAVMCAIDNLVKGAAGGAMQWLNRAVRVRGDDRPAGACSGLDMSMAKLRKVVTSITKALPDHLAPVFAQFPLEVGDASGVYLHTPGGRKVLDLYGGHAVAALGYGHPRWVEALTEQARSLCFQSNAVPLDVRRRAATKLAEFCGLGLDTIFFVNSGAEANENALKLACKMTGGTQVIAVEGSFPRAHGRRGRDHVGRAAEVVRLPARAVRRHVHQADGHRQARHRSSTTARPP